MGLFKELALLPLAPVRGTVWVADQLAQEADRRLYDEDNIKRELLQLELDAEDGVVGPEERERMERDLFERLAVARARVAEDASPFQSEDPEYPR
jgi:Gas vesicle protein G